MSALLFPEQFRAGSPVPTPSSVYTSRQLPVSSGVVCSLLSVLPLRDSWRWIFLPTEFSPVDTRRGIGGGRRKKERESTERKKQDRFGPFVEENGVISEARPEKARIPREMEGRASTMPGPRPPLRMNCMLGPR